MSYYDSVQDLALVDEHDTIIGRVEKWKAHEEGLLHRAFTVCVMYKGSVVLQHRKHPVFDNVIDLACSSHPYYVDDTLQDVQKAVISTLEREWGIMENEIKGVEHKGSYYYKADDPLSKYIEHEVCHLYVTEVGKIPSPVLEFAYGSSLLPYEKLFEKKSLLNNAFAPWVSGLIKLLEK